MLRVGIRTHAAVVRPALLYKSIALRAFSTHGPLRDKTLNEQTDVSEDQPEGNVKDVNWSQYKTRHIDLAPYESLESVEQKSSKGDLLKADVHDITQAAWLHPGFSKDEIKDFENVVPVAHHTPVTFTDKIAQRALLTVRRIFDWATGYKHPPPGKELDPEYIVSTDKWLIRFIFLESVAGVPGMVGGMVRHLHSLRLMRRDRAWMESLLEEAYNERMHLLTFITMKKPGRFMKLMILGAQGVFFNTFFICYLLFPRICHRFVGYLEEEAVVTYTRCIQALEAGKYPEWEKQIAPDIAINYWGMDKDATVKDLLYYVRADECKHREVNHTLGNLKQNQDRNPYALVVDVHKPQPAKDLKSHVVRPVGWKRDEIAA
jgi:ubiquinol oxidase